MTMTAAPIAVGSGDQAAARIDAITPSRRADPLLHRRRARARAARVRAVHAWAVLVRAAVVAPADPAEPAS
jgi:hypothetical protein